MKKLIYALISCLSLVFCFICTGCSNNVLDNSIYFNSTVSAYVYGESKAQELTIYDLSSNSPLSMRKYLKHSIKGNKDWIYGIYVEYIEFYILSSTTPSEDVEFDVTMTGTENGNTSTTSQIKVFEEKKIPVTLTANKPRLMRVDVNDTISLYTTDNELSIMLSDTYIDPGFEYCIYGLKVIGYHK